MGQFSVIISASPGSILSATQQADQPKPTISSIVWSPGPSLILPGVSCSNRSRHGGGSSSSSSQTVTCLPRTTSPSARSDPRASSARSTTASDQAGALRFMPDTAPSQALHASLASPHSAQSAISSMDASHSLDRPQCQHREQLPARRKSGPSAGCGASLVGSSISSTRRTCQLLPIMRP
jgi:hypothetical protein